MSDSGTSRSASSALLGAALGGLLCMSTQACGGSSIEQTEDSPQPATACSTGVSPNPKVSSTSVETLTKDQFQAQCDQRHGIFEVQPECGGSNACRGMSYDTNTSTLSEHDCRATNTCAGYTCVICD
ncbi:MAG: hypothetical protein ACRELY_30215 [Polyangiaceae bacterium]